MPPENIASSNYNSAKPAADKNLMKLYVDNEGYVTFPDGSRYKGNLDQGIPDGEGHIYYPDGTEYFGEWRAGNCHG